MKRRRIYVSMTELNYRGLKRLGLYTGECAGMIAERLVSEHVSHHVLTDDAFARWMQAEHRDIVWEGGREARQQQFYPDPRD